MAAKIITFLLILLVNLTAGFALLFFMALALNGFSERDANYAFLIFIVGGIVVSFLTAAAGVFLLKFLIKRNRNLILSVFLSAAAFSVLGFIINFVVWFIGILAADIVRKSR
jgi:hypothetical protein